MDILNKFKLYIDSFNDNYSADDILEIACVYKLFIPRSQKDWRQLANKIGYLGNPDSLRKRATKFIANNPGVEATLKKKFNIDSSELEEEFKFDTELLYKEKYKVQSVLNEYKRGLREEARIEDLKDRIQTAARSVNTYFSDTIVDYSNRNHIKEAVLLLSDWHIGVVVDNFYNKYNFEIAKNELKSLVKSVIDYCDKFAIYRLNIINMGDLIHGGIHTNARIEQEFDVVTQVELAGQLLYKTLAELEIAAPEVTYRSCSDNHARLMPNKSEHIEKENFGRLIDWWVEAKLEQGHHSIEVIKDNLDFGLGKFELLNGKKIMFAHGHEDPINQAYQNFTGATREFIDYILLAHFHNPKEKAFQDCRVIVNGSLVGTEQYALSKRLFTTPCQKLLIFDDNFVDITIHTNNYRG